MQIKSGRLVNYGRRSLMSQTIAIITFLAVIILITAEKIHRAAVAIAGAVVLLLTHVLTVKTSVGYIDFNTIGVLIGMMLFVAVVKCSGIFEYVSIKAAKLAKGDPWKIMLAFIIITAIFSAFLDNVTTVLLIGPMTIAIARVLGLDPIPFLLTQILASNIGGTATLIGDPPNIMIGSAAGLSFMDFMLNTGPAVVIILIVLCLCAKFVYGRKLVVKDSNIARVMEMDEKKAIVDRTLMFKSIIMIALVALGFVFHAKLGIESATVALAAAAIMLVIGKQDVDEIIEEVEWTTIIFFTGLFVVVGGLVETGVVDQLAQVIIGVTDGKAVMTMIILLWASALLSSILDNIPFVATLIPLIMAMGQSGMDVMPLWWAVSLGACLGGNGTLIGASANVVLSGIAGKHGHPISFKAFLQVGFPMMIISIIISTVYLMIRFA